MFGHLWNTNCSAYVRQPFICPSQVTTELSRHLHFPQPVDQSGLSGVCCNKKRQILLLNRYSYRFVRRSHRKTSCIHMSLCHVAVDIQCRVHHHQPRATGQKGRRQNRNFHSTPGAADNFMEKILTVCIILGLLVRRFQQQHGNDLWRSPLRLRTMKTKF